MSDPIEKAFAILDAQEHRAEAERRQRVAYYLSQLANREQVDAAHLAALIGELGYTQEQVREHIFAVDAKVKDAS